MLSLPSLARRCMRSLYSVEGVFKARHTMGARGAYRRGHSMGYKMGAMTPRQTAHKQLHSSLLLLSVTANKHKSLNMRFSSLLFAGLAAALPADNLVAPSPAISDVRIIDITAIGSGCPAGHAFVNVDATGTIFDVAFDEYIVSVGPGSSAADSRKNCRISINLEFPSGFQ